MPRGWKRKEAVNKDNDDHEPVRKREKNDSFCDNSTSDSVVGEDIVVMSSSAAAADGAASDDNNSSADSSSKTSSKNVDTENNTSYSSACSADSRGGKAVTAASWFSHNDQFTPFEDPTLLAPELTQDKEELPFAMLATRDVIPLFRTLVRSQMEQKQKGQNLNANIELECRFGRVIKSRYGRGYRFHPGVDVDFMDKVLKAFDDFAKEGGWDSYDEDWVPYTDFYYSVEDHHLRTSVRYDYNEKRAKELEKDGVDLDSLPVKVDEEGNFEHPVAKMTTEHLLKRKIHDLDLVTQPYESGSLKPSFELVPDLRISVSDEKQVSAEHLPDTVDPEYIRLKQRRSFVLNKYWRYDITRSWSGKTKAEAEQKQKGDAKRKGGKDPHVVNEIEIEMTNAEEYLNMENHDNKHVGLSILLKARDIVYVNCDKLWLWKHAMNIH